MIFVDTNIGKTDIEQVLETLSEDMRRRVLKYRQAVDRQRSAAAYRLLVSGLEGCFFPKDTIAHQTIHSLQLSVSEKGKPSLKNEPRIHFSLSHSGNAAICVIDDKEVGIDVEDRAVFSAGDLDEMIALTMNAQERATIENSEDRVGQFLLYWTQKEAKAKLTGEGLTDNICDLLSHNDGISIRSDVIEGRYIYSVAEYDSRK